jgi:hypothetical protein
MLPVYLLPPWLYRGASFRRQMGHCKEEVDAGKYPIATTITNLLIVAYIVLLVTMQKMEDSCPLLSNGKNSIKIA